MWNKFIIGLILYNSNTLPRRYWPPSITITLSANINWEKNLFPSLQRLHTNRLISTVSQKVFFRYSHLNYYFLKKNICSLHLKMAVTFTGPDAFKFLNLTPKATAVLQARPFLFVSILLTLTGLSSMILLGFYINYETGKPYRKPKTNTAKKWKPNFNYSLLLVPIYYLSLYSTLHITKRIETRVCFPRRAWMEKIN